MLEQANISARSSLQSSHAKIALNPVPDAILAVVLETSHIAEEDHSFAHLLIVVHEAELTTSLPVGPEEAGAEPVFEQGGGLNLGLNLRWRNSVPVVQRLACLVLSQLFISPQDRKHRASIERDGRVLVVPSIPLAAWI